MLLAARVPRPPVPLGRRQPEAGRDGADAQDRRPGAARRSADAVRSRATPKGSRLVTDGRARDGSTDRGSRSSRPCSSRSRPSPPPGAATRRAAGTASRRSAFSRANAATDRVDERVGPRERADADRRRDVHAVGRCLARERDASSPTSTSTRFRARVQARGRRVDRDAAAQEPGRAADAVRDAASTRSPRGPRREPLEAEAEAWSAKARADVQRATNYVLAVVLFATALFFAGMSARLRTRRVRALPPRLRGRDPDRDRHLDRDVPGQHLRLAPRVVPPQPAAHGRPADGA